MAVALTLVWVVDQRPPETPPALAAGDSPNSGLAGQGSSPLSHPINAASKHAYIAPQVLGQHLMYNSFLDPQIPVHAMRLWDSNTQWCQMDNGTAANRYNFGQLDLLFNQAARVGADVEFTFGDTPQWAATGFPQSVLTNPCSTGTQAMPPANESYWTDFVTALVTHSKGKIHAYELWNEADQPYSWSGSMAQLVQMSVDAASIIHKIDPSALVLSPSVTNSAQGYSFLNQYLSGLPQRTIDAIAVHSDTAGAWPEGAVSAEMNGVRSALPSNYANTPIWSTEGGWGQNSQFSSQASDQKAFVARYDLLMLAQGFARSYWYAYPNTQWGTLWNGTALTPAGIATRTLDSWLAGATFEGCATSDSNLWRCNVTLASGRRGQIAWVTTTPVTGYSTAGYTTVQALDGGSSNPGGSAITVTTEPVLLSS